MNSYSVYELSSIDKMIIKDGCYEETVELRNFLRGNVIDLEDIKVKSISYLNFKEDIGRDLTEETAYVEKYELFKTQGKNGTKIKKGSLVVTRKVEIIGIIDNFGNKIHLGSNDKIYFNVCDSYDTIVNMNINKKELFRLNIVE